MYLGQRFLFFLQLVLSITLDVLLHLHRHRRLMLALLRSFLRNSLQVSCSGILGLCCGGFDLIVEMVPAFLPLCMERLKFTTQHSDLPQVGLRLRVGI